MNIFGYLLTLVLLAHIGVSSYYGLSNLMRQPKSYPWLWKTKLRRICTFILHLMGLGGIAYHLDYLHDLISSSASGTKTIEHFE